MIVYFKFFDLDKKLIIMIVLNVVFVIVIKVSLGIWKVILNFFSCFEYYSWWYIFIFIFLIVIFIYVKMNKNVVVLNKVVM